VISVGELVDKLSQDLTGLFDAAGNAVPGGLGSLQLFAPELVICATILLILAVRVFNWGQRLDSFWLALAGSAVALWCALPPRGFSEMASVVPQEIFSGLMVYDSLSVYMRSLLLFFAVLFVLLTKLTGLVTKEESPDFYCLVLGATLGFCVMATANHLLTVFLGVEMASVPSYVMAGILKGRPKSSEAALKYAVYGAGAAGIMLYGISLIAGLLGTAHLPTVARQLAALDIPALTASGEGTQTLMVLVLGGLMIMVGLAFKLSAVPFHFWCPDVFEGAPAEVGALLSVASKAAAVTLLVRVVVGFGYVSEQPLVAARPANDSVLAATSDESQSSGTFSVVALETSTTVVQFAVAHEPAASEESASGDAVARLAPVRHFLAMLLAFIAAITCTFGNLAAYGQTNIKRMLAYSTIAHAGYMIMPVAAAMALAGKDPALAQAAMASLVFYVTIYLFMNLGAFAIVAFLRGPLGSEEIKDYSGLVYHAPFTAVCMVVILVSLVGIPPLAGFPAKFAVFASLVSAGGPVMITLLVIAGLNTAVSLVYYLRVIKTMTIDTPVDERPISGLRFLPATFVAAVTLPILVFGIWFGGVYSWAEEATRQLF